MKLFKTESGAVIEALLGEVSCGTELKAAAEDAALEKHVPVATQEGDLLKVVVGEVAHPMTEAHLITDIWAEFEDGSLERSKLVAGGAPETTFLLKGRKGKVVVYEYCNLHGLWKTELTIA